MAQEVNEEMTGPCAPACVRRAWLLLALVPPVLAAGCIRSRVEITSQVPGQTEDAHAEVIWRGQPYGATPITIPFIWYWYYDISLEKPGYKRLDTVEHFGTPPWFLFPGDLLMEIVPIPIHDTRHRSYVLEPKQKTEEPAPVQEITPALPPNP